MLKHFENSSGMHLPQWVKNALSKGQIVNNVIQLLSICLIVLLFSSFKTMPNDKSTSKYSLFNVGRSKDANEIFYDINLNSSGELNVENPIDIYWIKKTDGNRKEPLTWIQKKYAYGIKFLSVNHSKAIFQFVSYSERTLTLKKSKNGDFKVYLQSNNKEVEIKRIFVQIDGGTFWFPAVSKIEVKGYDANTGLPEIEIINP